MTSIPAPPEGFEVRELADDDDVLDPAKLLFDGPDGTVWTWAEMVAAGHFEVSNG
jgi:hypothetical protein